MSIAVMVVAPGLAFALLGFCHGEDPLGLRFSRRVRSIPAGIWIGNEASHHCNALDELGNALPEQKHEADEDERFRRPLRQAARLHRLFIDLKRSDEKRNRCDDHESVIGNKKNTWPKTSMLSRHRFGSMPLTMSMRMCSLDRRVHGEHKRNIAPNRIHCSSSQALDEVSNTFLIVALVAEMITTTRISQHKTLPIRKLTASMARLSLSKPSTYVSPWSRGRGLGEPPVPPPGWTRRRRRGIRTFLDHRAKVNQ